MKKIFNLLFVALISLSINSCDQEINPKNDLVEYYSINCIIRCDSTNQFATVSKMYDVPGYDPNSNTVDPFVKGAKITLSDSSVVEKQKTVYQFRDTSVIRGDESRYSTPLNGYYIKNFNAKSASILKIEVILPNGVKIKSSTFYLPLNPYSVEFYRRDNPRYINSNQLMFDWNNLIYLYESKPYAYPEFIIKYSHYESGEWKKYQKKIPISYSMVEGKEIPVYPRMNVSSKNIVYDTLTIRKTFEKISADDLNRNNYRIDKVVFMLQIVDSNLANYIAVQQMYTDDFSINVTQYDNTTFSGARGIFASMQTLQMEVSFTSMIKSLGYATK